MAAQVRPEAGAGKPSRTPGSGALRWIGLPISALAIFILARNVDVSAAVAVLAQADVAPLVAATGLIAVQVAMVTARWRLLLPDSASGHRPRYLGTARALLVGYLGNFVLPARLGEAVRAYLVGRLEALPMAGTFASVILERVVDTASIALIALVVAVALDAEPWVIQVTGLVALVGVAAFLAVALGLVGTLSRALIRLVPSRFQARLLDFGALVDDFSRGLSAHGRISTIAFVALISVVSWGLEAGVYALVGLSLGIEMSLAQALVIAAITVLATAIPSAPAYLGTFELAATAVMVGLLGIPEAEALAFAVLVHVTTVVPLAIGGLVSLSTIGLGLVPLARMARAAEDQKPLQTSADG
jgi:uncharacterized protein (TIRG00374 family)